MKKNIITISRQLGSGGRSIGKMLSERLGIPFCEYPSGGLSSFKSPLGRIII